tara:strand:+ start:351 stop:569 length:219 start_codon:yes stop_codon:yes gene_type:complete
LTATLCATLFLPNKLATWHLDRNASNAVTRKVYGIKKPPNFLDGVFASSLGLTSTAFSINFSPNLSLLKSLY